jgi:3',5'-cyclic AMP phosphodiesterase CpdA
LSRRQLLKGGLAWLASAWATSPREARAGGTPRSGAADYTRCALLSDTHIAEDPDNRFRGFYPYRNLREISAQLEDRLPDRVIITGDLARLKGQTGAYENFKTLLAPLAEKRPIHLGLGNHDDREHFFRTFTAPIGSGLTIENKHVVVAEAGPVRLIVLDTLFRVNIGTGELGQPQRGWLEAFLQTCDERPTILFLHHTPDSDLLDTRPLFEILRPLHKVKAVVYGHSHRFGFSQIAGIHLVNLPATGFNFSGSQPVGWVEARLTAQGGELTLHTIGGNRNLEGHTHRLSWRA